MAEEAEARSFLRAAYPEALLIALLTAGMYWSSFVYEFAYLTSYGLPAHLVEVNLHIFFQVAPMMILVAFCIIMVGSTLRSSPRETRRKAYRILVCLFFPMSYVSIHGFRSEDWLIYGGIVLGIAVFEFALPLLVIRNEPTVSMKLLAFEEALYLGIPAYIGVTIVVFLLGTYHAYLWGQVGPRKQITYLVFDDMPNVAVVRVYDDTILGVSFDPQTKAVKPQVIIRKIGDDSSVKLTHANIGPLLLPTYRYP